MQNNYHLRLKDVNQMLSHNTPQRFITLLRHGSMSVEYFMPKDIDTQKPHRQDELYVIAAGETDFDRNGELLHCSKGDVLFVPAGMEHRFKNFSPDFATWVIFYGQDGGEAS